MKINIQLHALPMEMIRFAEECIKEYQLVSAAIRFIPEFTVVSVKESNYRTTIEKLGHIDAICFCKNEPSTRVDSLYQFAGANPESLVLQIGKYDENLTESVLSGQTDDSEVFRNWGKIAEKLKGISLAGVWVINEYTGAKSFNKNRRYTNGAKEKFQNGVKMIAFTGGFNYFLFD